MKEVQVKAKLSRLRISPRKVRLVADLIRQKPVEEARQLLKFSVKGPAQPMGKLLDSAVANARHNFKLDGESLTIRQIKVDEGPIYKRFRPASRGRVAPIQKKTSHITLVLAGQPAAQKEPEKTRVVSRPVSSRIGKSKKAKAV